MDEVLMESFLDELYDDVYRQQIDDELHDIEVAALLAKLDAYHNKPETRENKMKNKDLVLEIEILRNELEGQKRAADYWFEKYKLVSAAVQQRDDALAIIEETNRKLAEVRRFAENVLEKPEYPLGTVGQYRQDGEVGLARCILAIL